MKLPKYYSGDDGVYHILNDSQHENISKDKNGGYSITQVNDPFVPCKGDMPCLKEVWDEELKKVRI